MASVSAKRRIHNENAAKRESRFRTRRGRRKLAVVTLRLLPPLHRFALRLAHIARLTWWQVRRPEVHGCNVIVGNPRGEVLLVRHSYHSTGLWMLPGGGIGKHENAVQAAIREVAEETGCAIEGAREIAVETVRTSGARNHIHLVAATTADTPAADGREIVAAAFFDPGALPEATTAAACGRIERCAGAAQNSLS